VPLADQEVDVLAATLELLAGDEDLRSRMAVAARDYARREHDLERVADRYVEAIEEMAGGKAVRDLLFTEVSHAAAEVGMSANDPQVAEIAARLREVGFGH
jgi:hypothetical protein